MNKYTCQCTRCNASGNFDKGTCFDCKGTGFVNSVSTRGLTPFVLTVTYSNGTENKPRVFASSRKIAISIVERMLRVKGWGGIVK
jgi:DnaJ-class molecular chaperone